MLIPLFITRPGMEQRNELVSISAVSNIPSFTQNGTKVWLEPTACHSKECSRTKGDYIVEHPAATRGNIPTLLPPGARV